MKTQTQTNLMAATLAAMIATLFCFFAAQPALAATDTWNGGAAPDGSWQTPGNWNGATPATNDLLIFAGSTQTATVNNYPAGTPFNNISFSSGASAFTLDGNSMILSSPTDAGSGNIKNGSINDVSASTETIKMPIVLASGYHTISSSGGGTLKLNGSITHSNGAVATMSGNINVTGGLNVAGNANGILGGWAIFNNNWATLDASSNVVAYSAYTDISGSGPIADNAASNVRITASSTAVNLPAGTTHINSLYIKAGTANQTVSLNAGSTLVLGQNGGIYNSSATSLGGTFNVLTVGASSAPASGILTAGDGINPAQITLGSDQLPNANGFITVNASIQDNNLLGNHAPVSVTLAGAYSSLNGVTTTSTQNMSTNTYSGGTYILFGRVSQPNPFTFGFGPVYIVSGGQANVGCQITNDFYVEGSGTVEKNGMGAVRMFAAGGTYGYIGNLGGTVHLTGNAAFGANNTAFSGAALFIGISGKITGPGGLMISSPTATASGAGTINIGSTNGAFDIPNDYAGDTTVNGTTTGGTELNSTLRICNAADNNIMPHGANGSYAGGKTGNLILNATAANRQAIFELNGSIQTINGLSSTAASPVNNIVQDTIGGGSLILGDNNATATYGGIIQGGLPITKIGTGTETFSGANTYTGYTIVKAGTLVANTASTGGGNYSISNSAALGVNVATIGSTLFMTNLTFDVSGTALNLNAGTNGNPTAAIVLVTNALTLNGNVNISLSGVGLTPGVVPLLAYNPANRSGSGNFVLNNSPRVVGTLNDDKVNGLVTITITSADSAVKWNGGSAGNWDISDAGNTIWQTVPSGNTTFYIESGSGNDVVLFNDTLTGTNTVNLATSLTPQGITVSNNAVNYLFSGNGKLTGATGLTKQGNGTLTIANSGNNDFSGPIALTTGTLVISNSSSIANTISGSGALVKNGSGTLTLSGDGSAYTGTVTVNGGTLSVLNTLSLGSATNVTIANGATLDIGINSVALGLETNTVSGSGVGGNGAIVNSSGYAGGAVATSFQTLAMTGDTTIGGPGRLDFRSTDPNGGADATLSTGGHAYNLTKTSVSTLQMASVQIDSALANINVQQGILSFQGNMPSLGNPGSAINVSGGATLQFFNMNNELNKAIFLSDGASVNNSGGSAIFDGPVTLLGNAFFNVAGTSLTFTNVISGAGGSLSKVTGTAPMTLTASNTYTGNTLIGAGTLLLSEPGDISSSGTITIGAGATLDVNGRNNQTLTLLGGHSLTGSGTLNGNLTNLPASTVAPGIATAIGTLTVNGNATLNGKTVMKLDKSVSPFSDVLTVNGNLNYGGALVVTNSVGTPAAGDSFQLFNGSISGSFSSISLPSLGLGLVWNTNAIYSGTLSVSQLLTITNFTLSGTGLSMAGVGGSPDVNFILLSSTNIALPLAQWTPVVTNTFDDGGNFNFTTNVDISLPRQFYILSQ